MKYICKFVIYIEGPMKYDVMLCIVCSTFMPRTVEITVYPEMFSLEVPIYYFENVHLNPIKKLAGK